MNVLLSIKPEFALKIFNGTKKFEFRKTIFKNQNIKKVVVYASSPVKKIIGEFEIDCIIHSEIDSLWEETSHDAGIEREFFYRYFSNKKFGYAIKIKNCKTYKKPYCIKQEFGLAPPQSFAYI